MKRRSGESGRAKGVAERGNKWRITSGRRGGGANFKNHGRSNRRDLEGFRDELGNDDENTISHPSPSHASPHVSAISVSVARDDHRTCSIAVSRSSSPSTEDGTNQSAWPIDSRIDQLT